MKTTEKRRKNAGTQSYVYRPVWFQDVRMIDGNGIFVLLLVSMALPWFKIIEKKQKRQLSHKVLN